MPAVQSASTPGQGKLYPRESCNNSRPYNYCWSPPVNYVTSNASTLWKEDILLKLHWDWQQVSFCWPNSTGVTPKYPANFKHVYLNPKLRNQFADFLQNVFNLYPEEDFHALITETVKSNTTDEAIYKAIQEQLGGYHPRFFRPSGISCLH